MNLDEHILQALARTPTQTRTIGDLARQFGISPTVVRPAARRLVDEGLVRPAFAYDHGVRTLRGLLSGPAATPGPVAQG